MIQPSSISDRLRAFVHKPLHRLALWILHLLGQDGASPDFEIAVQAIKKQRDILKKKNKELEKAKAMLEEKASELDRTSRYKSEFLANMSHELRTPLNSIILLSKLLADNRDRRLEQDVVESLETIYSSGVDLLKLINEILDLSKIEAGKLEIYPEPVSLRQFCEGVEKGFKAVVKDKGLEFRVEMDEGTPEVIHTDQQRFEQIIRNFISNAIKFTEQGAIRLSLRPVPLMADQEGEQPGVGISVIDTGIGIPAGKQELIFQAFRQADGSISRRYGGTGLGLSISLELARLLGGSLHLESEEGRGATFSLTLPVVAPTDLLRQESEIVASPDTADDQRPEEENSDSPTGGQSARARLEAIIDDRKKVTPVERSVLIIEDDPGFARILKELAHEHGFLCLVAGDGETGLQFADYYKPSVIILDIALPGINGLEVMCRLKEHAETRHIPVSLVSISDRKVEARKMGAVDFLVKPAEPEAIRPMFEKLARIIDKPVKDLLLVEDESIQCEFLSSYLACDDIRISRAANARQGLEQVLGGGFDCMILDIGLPDMSGFELLEKVRAEEEGAQLPVIVYSARELSNRERARLDSFSEKIILKEADSHQKLLDEVSLFLHRREADLPDHQKEVISRLHDWEAILRGKTIMLVDDDMRNVFSIKKLLQDKGVGVRVAKNGRECLESLARDPEVDLILMDIMMPVMDGYEAMQEIRKQQRFARLPLLALTAKAMKGDRAKCIEAGANDYLAKPVDPDRLLSMLRVWLY